MDGVLIVSVCVCHVENLLNKGAVKQAAQTVTTMAIVSTYLQDVS